MPENDHHDDDSSLEELARDFLRQLPSPEAVEGLAEWFTSVVEAAIGLGMSVGLDAPETARRYLDTSPHEFTKVSQQLMDDVDEAVGDFK